MKWKTVIHLCAAVLLIFPIVSCGKSVEAKSSAGTQWEHKVVQSSMRPDLMRKHLAHWEKKGWQVAGVAGDKWTPLLILKRPKK